MCEIIFEQPLNIYNRMKVCHCSISPFPERVIDLAFGTISINKHHLTQTIYTVALINGYIPSSIFNITYDKQGRRNRGGQGAMPPPPAVGQGGQGGGGKKNAPKM